MTKPIFEDLSPARRRAAVFRALLRALITAALMVALYYLMPMDHELDVSTVALLTLGVAALAAIIVWQVRAILKSAFPPVRAIEALASTVPLFLLLFATVYFLMGQMTPANFTQPLSRTDALYFSVTIFATVGFGDISAKSETARLVVTVQMVLDLLFLGLGARVFIGAVRRGEERRSAEASDAGPAS